jgi:hypothetical protein
VLDRIDGEDLGKDNKRSGSATVAAPFGCAAVKVKIA